MDQIHSSPARNKHDIDAGQDSAVNDALNYSPSISESSSNVQKNSIRKSYPILSNLVASDSPAPAPSLEPLIASMTPGGGIDADDGNTAAATNSMMNSSLSNVSSAITNSTSSDSQNFLPYVASEVTVGSNNTLSSMGEAGGPPQSDSPTSISISGILSSTSSDTTRIMIQQAPNEGDGDSAVGLNQPIDNITFSVQNPRTVASLDQNMVVKLPVRNGGGIHINQIGANSSSNNINITNSSSSAAAPTYMTTNGPAGQIMTNVTGGGAVSNVANFTDNGMGPVVATSSDIVLPTGVTTTGPGPTFRLQTIPSSSSSGEYSYSPIPVQQGGGGGQSSMSTAVSTGVIPPVSATHPPHSIQQQQQIYSIHPSSQPNSQPVSVLPHNVVQSLGGDVRYVQSMSPHTMNQVPPNIDAAAPVGGGVPITSSMQLAPQQGVGQPQRNINLSNSLQLNQSSFQQQVASQFRPQQQPQQQQSQRIQLSMQQHPQQSIQQQQPIQQQQQQSQMPNGPGAAMTIMINTSQAAAPSQYITPAAGGTSQSGAVPGPGHGDQQQLQQQMNMLPPPMMSGVPTAGTTLNGPSGGGAGFIHPNNAAVGGDGGGVGGGGAASAGANNSQGAEKRKLIQQQLVLLLHAHKCQRRTQKAAAQGQTAGPPPCQLPHCQTMRVVLNHMMSCTDGKACRVPHCVSSRQIIQHWRNCNNSDCPVCQPLRQASNSKAGAAAGGNLQQREQMDSLGQFGLQMGGAGLAPPPPPPPGVPAPSFQFQQQPHQMVDPSHGSINSAALVNGGGSRDTGSVPPPLSTNQQQQQQLNMSLEYATADSSQPSGSQQPLKQWQKNINADQRNHMVRKIVEAIYPNTSPKNKDDPRLRDLVEYAKRVERDTFFNSQTQEDYYRTLAEKIYRIQKELRDLNKKRKRDNSGDLINSNPSSSGGPGSQLAALEQGLMDPYEFSPGSGGGGPGAIAPTSQLGQSHQMAAAPPPPMALNEKRRKLKDALDQETAKRASSSLTSHDDATSNNPTAPLAAGSQSSATFAGVKIEPGLIKTEKGPVGGAAGSTGSVAAGNIKKEHDTAAAAVIKKETSLAVKPKVPKKIFKKQELEEALLPSWQEMWDLDCQGSGGGVTGMFTQAVDPVALGIPDYVDVVKEPMDLSTIRRKMEDGDYQTPWEYIRDVNLMFENCFMYNKKGHRVYKLCLRLKDAFRDSIDETMQALGYCCGQKYVFNPPILCCYGAELCTITKDALYYIHDDKYVFCKKCFDEARGPTVEVVEDPEKPPMYIEKSKFTEKKNDVLEPEKFVRCTDCERELHEICVLYSQQIWPEGFTCSGCLKQKGMKRRPNRHRVSKLPDTSLSQFLEKQVNDYLQASGHQLRPGEAKIGKVHIRVLSSSDKHVEVRPIIKRYLENEENRHDFPSKFPYRSKSIFASQEIDGVDVVFFGMHVQEYGSSAPPPNSRRVYLSYLDSVRFFQPPKLRTNVYHQILINYLEFCRNLGYCYAHIWACPPSEGDDYIFHAHPPEQKVPKAKRLVEWYKRMLDAAQNSGIIYNYKDIYKTASDNEWTSVGDIPYFDGDYWPNVIEDSIKELEEEEMERRKQEEYDAAMYDEDEDSEGPYLKKWSNKKKKAKKKSDNGPGSGSRKSSTLAKKTGSNANFLSEGNELFNKVHAFMEQHKDVFFTVQLLQDQTMRRPLDDIIDPDRLITGDLMDGRDQFLGTSRENHLEFSSLRVAKYSSMIVVLKLHEEKSIGGCIYTCNNCRSQVETRYHCTVCDDFDLCKSCYEKMGHEHPMEMKSPTLMDVGSVGGGMGGIGGGGAAASDQQKASIQKCLEYVLHACQCRDANCKLSSCHRMRKIVNHARTCRQKQNGGCNTCKQLIALCCYHAKHCVDGNCKVPFCANIKQKLRDQQDQQRLKRHQLMRRRMALMRGHNRHDGGPSAGGTIGVGSGAASGASSSSSSTSHHMNAAHTQQYHPPHGATAAADTPVVNSGLGPSRINIQQQNMVGQQQQQPQLVNVAAAGMGTGNGQIGGPYSSTSLRQQINNPNEPGGVYVQQQQAAVGGNLQGQQHIQQFQQSTGGGGAGGAVVQGAQGQVTIINRAGYGSTAAVPNRTARLHELANIARSGNATNAQKQELGVLLRAHQLQQQQQRQATPQIQQQQQYQYVDQQQAGDMNMQQPQSMQQQPQFIEQQLVDPITGQPKSTIMTPSSGPGHMVGPNQGQGQAVQMGTGQQQQQQLIIQPQNQQQQQQWQQIRIRSLPLQQQQQQSVMMTGGQQQQAQMQQQFQQQQQGQYRFGPNQVHMAQQPQQQQMVYQQMVDVTQPQQQQQRFHHPPQQAMINGQQRMVMQQQQQQPGMMIPTGQQQQQQQYVVGRGANNGGSGQIQRSGPSGGGVSAGGPGGRLVTMVQMPDQQNQNVGPGQRIMRIDEPKNQYYIDPVQQQQQQSGGGPAGGNIQIMSPQGQVIQQQQQQQQPQQRQMGGPATGGMVRQQQHQASSGPSPHPGSGGMPSGSPAQLGGPPSTPGNQPMTNVNNVNININASRQPTHIIISSTPPTNIGSASTPQQQTQQSTASAHQVEIQGFAPAPQQQPQTSLTNINMASPAGQILPPITPSGSSTSIHSDASPGAATNRPQQQQSGQPQQQQQQQQQQTNAEQTNDLQHFVDML